MPFHKGMKSYMPSWSAKAEPPGVRTGFDDSRCGHPGLGEKSQ